ncbi:MAG: PH domain-containing protein [Muribaculaceae bacterium]|nr:PH domain-containing protein [Muribaculaceae bacterium]
MKSLAPLSIAGVYDIITSSSGDIWKFILLIMAVCVTVPFVWALISYLPKKFYIKDGNLVFIHGIIDHESTIVPLDRVHSLRTEKGIWFRLLDMRGIIFDTLATRKEEIELILDEYEWKRLLEVIDRDGKQCEASQTATEETESTHTVCYPTKNLVLAALCQNHLKGMAVMGSIFAVVFGNLQDLSKEATDTAAGVLDSFFDSLIDSPLRLVVFLAIAYLAILVMWLGKVLLRYYDTSLIYDNKLLTFSYGLLTRASSRFFFDRICTISIKRNFLEKKFGFSTLMLRQALNARAEKEDDNMKLYGSDCSDFFLRWWLGEDYEKEEDFVSARSGKGVFYRYVILRALVALGIAIGLICSELYAWSLLPLIYLVVLFPKGLLAMRHSRIELKKTYCIVHNGSFAETANYIKYSDIEVAGIFRSPLTRRTHRASLVLSTSGTAFTIRSLRVSEANIIREYLLLKSE